MDGTGPRRGRSGGGEVAKGERFHDFEKKIHFAIEPSRNRYGTWALYMDAAEGTGWPGLTIRIGYLQVRGADGEGGGGWAHVCAADDAHACTTHVRTYVRTRGSARA